MTADVNITEQELDRRLAVAREVPAMAHLILCGSSPTCEECGGTSAPIVGGKHLDPEKWCER
jgi:hypothetical protein